MILAEKTGRAALQTWTSEANGQAQGLFARAMEIVWRAARARTPPPLLSVDVKAFGLQSRFSNAKVRRDLGWSPRVGVEDGMRHALDFLAEHLAARPHRR